jgi:hypothetical protein
MEDLDAIAGGVAYKHLVEPGVTRLQGSITERGFYVVTAAVERLDMLLTLTPKNVKDLRLSGQVIYTGRSSMEVVVKMETLNQTGREETIMLGEYNYQSIIQVIDRIKQGGSRWSASTRSQIERGLLIRWLPPLMTRKHSLRWDKVPMPNVCQSNTLQLPSS